MFRDNLYIAHIRKKDGRGQKLDSHLLNVSAMAGEFASVIGLKDHGELLGLLHDFGKASEEFQRYIKSSGENTDNLYYWKGKVDHSTAGAQIANKFVNTEVASLDYGATLTGQFLSLCIASHHSGLIDCISPEGEDIFKKRICKMEEESHVSEIFDQKLSENVKEDVIKKLRSKKLRRSLLEKVRKLKNTDDSEETLAFKCGLLVRFLFSCLLDADRLDTANFEAPDLAGLKGMTDDIEWTVFIKRLNKKLDSFNQNEINFERQCISEACQDFSKKPKGLYLLTVPTGGGKTLSSLRFALNHANKHEMRRIIYVLPYTTIIDQNANEMRLILEREKDERGRIVLEHHSNLLPEEETRMQRILAENWDAPIVLTTSVQVLEALFGSRTRGARRMHRLAGSVIIFDEIQTLPVKCIHMFNVAMDFLVNICGSTVVLCTATQPLLDKIEPKSRALSITNKHQIIPHKNRLFARFKRVEVYDQTKVGGWAVGEVAKLAIKQIEKFGSALIVVNTKKTAREVYQKCKQITSAKTFHLSANMCPAHRLKTIDRVKAHLLRKKPTICVSTQLIEAGVDISFGSVIRSIAGLDSIAQAAGRCNRHNELSPTSGEVYIINPADESFEGLDDIRVGKEKCERLLADYKKDPARFRNDIIGPKSMEQYFQYYFYQRAEEMNYPVTIDGYDDDLFNLLSLNTLSVREYMRKNDNNKPDFIVRQAFMSAAKSFKVIDTIARGIIVPYGKKGKELIDRLRDANEIDRQYELIRKAQRYSINIYPNILKRLRERMAIYEVRPDTEILYLDEHYYDNEFGLNELPDMPFLYV
jgi:CRISPR-associated endonuclease/helicase Cas3